MRRLKITDVEHASAGDKAGLLINDVLDAYDGKPLDSLQSLLETVSKSAEGMHTIQLIRANRVTEVVCESGRLGVGVVDIDIDDEEYQAIFHNTAFETKCSEVILTTSQLLDGYRTEVIEVITAECVFGMNIFRDFFAGLSDVFGGRSKSTQNILRDARVVCLNEMKKEAARVGANAVIAMNLDYSEFSGGGKSMLFLVASGTAVRAIKTQ